MGPLIHFKSSITTLSISFIIIMCISFFSKVSNHKLINTSSIWDDDEYQTHPP